ncbi:MULTISPECIES: DsbE family thiol:disulfide interchange protein [unclassified Undibacterium]|uniref:DsbE family thiol:disulfide interchange protein n=1 Tax=unclassified Undibacterium TaxID=2630295 RepID=UPI002AC8B3E6|nr:MULTISPECIES: DsbE family thiol:disulfide interchange protein [unclassified Undibacterium]MEB0140063.1 DsbE family thiol:disulfide interchange protein [Undibacterium sp. CCC2.1]MEB0173173.1 DsbE family thiol:disulfide interchange protein [Undibacterium sp. CCC1.1]MEB0176900.1 DsbE family thiol:disulfide interchange protein [Undibacterium sp. CCC3.4]MEB0216187.1 DsbE family thiol:disulfide interchange protein [Undibacterium sp. 5I2]WPX41945.1 DsbE family thiol:disulfide interchange protein [
MMRALRLGLPLLVLVLLSIVLARGLQLDPRHLPSVQVGKAAPAFSRPSLAPAAAFSTADLRGQVWIMNVFASWCSACISEHPRLLKLAAEHQLPLIGLAYKDEPDATRQWLQEHGNPYRQVALDIDGSVAIDYGVYGVPETFVIDAKGIIRYRHVGPIDDDFYAVHIAPLQSAAAQ